MLHQSPFDTIFKYHLKEKIEAYVSKESAERCAKQFINDTSERDYSGVMSDGSVSTKYIIDAVEKRLNLFSNENPLFYSEIKDIGDAFIPHLNKLLYETRLYKEYVFPPEVSFYNLINKSPRLFEKYLEKALRSFVLNNIGGLTNLTSTASFLAFKYLYLDLAAGFIAGVNRFCETESYFCDVK